MKHLCSRMLFILQRTRILSSPQKIFVSSPCSISRNKIFGFACNFSVLSSNSSPFLIPTCSNITPKDFFHCSSQYHSNIYRSKTFKKNMKLRDKKHNQTENLETILHVAKPKGKFLKELDMVQLFSEEDMLIGKMRYGDAKIKAKDEGYRLAKMVGEVENNHLSFKMVRKENPSQEMDKEDQSMFKKELKKTKKREKNFVIGSKIYENELKVKLNQMSKNLEKGFPIKVVIKDLHKADTEQGKKSMAEIVKTIGTELKDVAIIKRAVASNTGIQLLVVTKDELLSTEEDEEYNKN